MATWSIIILVTSLAKFAVVAWSPEYDRRIKSKPDLHAKQHLNDSRVQ